MMSRLNLACVIVMAAASSAALGQVINPSFESPGTTTIFQGWETFENAVPEFSLVHSGFVGLKVYGNGGGAYNAAGAFQDFPITPGETWTASAWVLNSSTDPILASNFGAVNIEWRDATGIISFDTVTAANAATPVDTWRQVSVTGTAPAGATTARLVLLHIQGPELASGAVFFDDASFTLTNPTGLVNAGFETASGASIPGWVRFGNVFGDGTLVHGGATACKMFGNWTGGENASGVYQEFPAAPGETWAGQAFAATSAADHVGPGNFAVLNIEWRDSTNQLISFASAPALNENSPPDVWNQVNVQSVAPAGTVKARIVLLHIQPLFSGGAAWWDDVTFGQVTGPTCDADVNQDGNPDQGDVDFLVDVVAGGDNYTNIDPDFNHDGNVDQGDIDALINVIAGGDCP